MDWRGRGSNGLCTFSSHRTLFDPRQPDAAFQDQVNELRGLGFGILRVSVDELGQKGCKIRGVVPEGSTVEYRGWVLARSEYEALLKLIATHGAHPITSLETYLACHYLPNWYPLVAEFTPETKVFHVTGDTIEGGVCVRRFEDFVPNSERRYFVIGNKPYAAQGPVPDVVFECARRIKSHFFAVDVALKYERNRAHR
jgi:hypothetical protein